MALFIVQSKHEGYDYQDISEYTDIQEAINHINFQMNVFHSTALWRIKVIKGNSVYYRSPSGEPSAEELKVANLEEQNKIAAELWCDIHSIAKTAIKPNGDGSVSVVITFGIPNNA